MACELKTYGGCDLFKKEVKQSLKNFNIQKTKEEKVLINSAEISRILGILTLLWESDEISNREFVQKQIAEHPELSPFIDHIFKRSP